MRLRQAINLAWYALWRPAKHQPGPVWARALVASSVAVSAGLVLTLLSGLLDNNAANMDWWRGVLPGTVLAGVVTACAALAFNRMLELLLSQQALELVSRRCDWRAAAYLSAVVVSGTAAGIPAGLAMADILFATDLWRMALDPQQQVRFVAFLAVLAAACLVGERLHVHQRDLQQELADARLRLLQAQVEPHRLFDTLENVHALVDANPQGAKLALEELTDHLRENLGRLREAESVLAARLPPT